jgi:hypothetical protein
MPEALSFAESRRQKLIFDKIGYISSKKGYVRGLNVIQL